MRGWRGKWNLHVVALVRVVRRRDVAVLGVERGEGRAGREDGRAVRPGDGLLERALGLGERVREREEDGASADAAGVHGRLEGPDDGLGEDAVRCRQADERGRLDILDHLLEGLELVSGVVVAREELLVIGETVTTVIRHEALGVDNVELVLCLGVGETTARVVLEELLGDTDAGTAGAHEDELLVLNRHI